MSHTTADQWLSGFQGQRLRTKVRDQLVVVTLDNAPVNALDSVFYQEIHDVFQALSVSDSVSAVLLRADHRCFCAGQDRRDAPVPPADPATYLRNAATALIAATQCPVPMVAGVKGAAIGAGFILALSADVLVLDADATLSLPELKFGVISGYAHLSQWVGQGAAQAVLTGDHIDAHALISGGAIVIPTNEVDAEAERLANSIAESAPSFIKATKSSWMNERKLVADAYRQEIELTIDQGSMNFSLPMSAD